MPDSLHPALVPLLDRWRKYRDALNAGLDDDDLDEFDAIIIELDEVLKEHSLPTEALMPYFSIFADPTNSWEPEPILELLGVYRHYGEL